MSSRKLIGSQRPANSYTRSGVYVPDEIYSDRLENKNIVGGSIRNKTFDVYPQTVGNSDPYLNHVVMHIPGAKYTSHMAKDHSGNNWDEYFYTSSANGSSNLQEMPVVDSGPRENFSSCFFGGDYYTVTDAASLRLGSNSFTIEFWVKHCRTYTTGTTIQTPAGNTYIMAKAGQAGVTTGTGWAIFITTNNSVGFFDAVSNSTITSATPLQYDTWAHVAIVRTGTGSNQLTIYVDGVSSAIGTSSGNFADTNNMRIGTDASATANYWFGGNLFDIRIKTSAVYTAAFTPPSAMLDMTGSVFSLSGTDPWHPLYPSLQPQGLTVALSGSTVKRTDDYPFKVNFPKPTGSGYSSSKIGNRGWQLADFKHPTANLSLGTTFTIESWVYLSQWGSSNRVALCGKGTGNEATAGATGWNFGSNSSRFLTWADGANALATGNIALSMGAWNHISAVREGTGSNQFKMFVNGQVCYVGTLATSYAGDVTNPLILFGSRNFQYHFFNSRAYGLRISANARYTASFTINKTTFFDTVATNDANTRLYMLDSKTDTPRSPKPQFVSDGYEVMPVQGKTYGSTRIGGKSLFNSCGYSVQNWRGAATSTLYALTSNSSFSFGTGNFSIEFWFCNAYEWDRLYDASARILFDTRSSFNSSGLVLEYEYRSLRLMTAGKTIIADQTGYFAQRSWTHVCVQRSNGYIALYINGRKVEEVYYPATIASDNNKLYIMNGSPLTQQSRPAIGWMSDFRICKPQGAYSYGAGNPETFVLPTEPLPVTSTTVLLTANSPTLKDSSAVGNFVSAGNYGDANYTSTWDVWVTPFSPYKKEYVPSIPGDSWDFSGSGGYVNTDSDSGNYNHNELMWIMRMEKPWTIEYWIYHYQDNPTSLTARTHYYTSGTNNADGWQFIAHYSGTANSYNDLSFMWRSNRLASNTNEFIATSGNSSNLKPHSWNHVAVVFDPTKTTKVAMFVNGSRVATRGSFTPTYRPAYYEHLQSAGTAGIGDLRISDIARYDTTSGTLSVPTATWTRDANTASLIKLDSMYENLPNAASWIADGLPLPSYQYSKWGGGSMYFRNLDTALVTYDRFYISHYNNWADRVWDTRYGDFTVEGWANWRLAANGGRAFPASVACLYHHQNTIWVGINSTGNWQLLYRSTGTTAYTGVVFSTPIVSTGSNWDHWALVRLAGDYYLFINGVLCQMLYGGNHGTYTAGTGPTYTKHDDWYDVNNSRLGCEYNDTIGTFWCGHVEDFRMTALARYQNTQIGLVNTMCHIGTNIPALPTTAFPRK